VQERLVAAVVAERVVDALEVVEVQQQERRIRTVAARAAQLSLE
jgi:hypothetical protein